MLASRIALRYLFSRKSHAAVNIISYVSMGAVAIAAAAMVIVLSVFDGFADFAASRLQRLDPDLRVTPVEGKAIADAESLAATLSHIPGVAEAWPRVEERAFAATADSQTPVVLVGLPQGSSGARAYTPLLIDGASTIDGSEALRAGGCATALSSVGVANALTAIPGSGRIIGIYEPRRTGRLNPSNPLGAFITDSLIVTGVYSVGQQEFDSDMLVTDIATVRRLLEYDNGEASSLDIAISPGANAADVQRAVAQKLGDSYIVADRLQQRDHSFKMIAVEKWVTLAMLIFILAIASFNILSTLAILRIDKRDNAFTLFALGLEPRRIARVYFLLSAYITCIGGAVGLAAGSLLAWLQQHFGLVRLSASDPSQLAIDVYPVTFSFANVLIVAAIIAVMALLTALPSLFTSRR